MDIVSTQKRSEMMSKIGAKNTKPEIIILKLLHSEGYRFRLHLKRLPGKPDIALQKHNTLIFVNGCFWHGHSCDIFRLPKSRTEFWRTKIDSNKERDKRNFESLRRLGWRILVIWECALKGKNRLSQDKIVKLLNHWFESDIAEAYITAEGLEVLSETPP